MIQWVSFFPLVAINNITATIYQDSGELVSFVTVDTSEQSVNIPATLYSGINYNLDLIATNEYGSSPSSATVFLASGKHTVHSTTMAIIS